MWKYEERKLLVVWQGGEIFSEYSKEYRTYDYLPSIHIYLYTNRAEGAPAWRTWIWFHKSNAAELSEKMKGEGIL